MRIPDDPEDRERFYLDVIEKCSVSMQQRQVDAGILRSWYLFGAEPTEPPALYNKIFPHIDQLTSFLYSAETTRFSINTGADVSPLEQFKIPVLTRALNDEWLNSNAGPSIRLCRDLGAGVQHHLRQGRCKEGWQHPPLHG